jgi:hypothetical protein
MITLSTPNTNGNGHTPPVDNTPAESLFPLGRVVATPGALEALQSYPNLTGELLTKHVKGDWGDVCDEDAMENDLSVEHGFRILSAYKTPGGERIWIITESDRSSTTLLLPEEY